MITNVVDKHVKCGMCFASSTWPKIFQLIKKWGHLKFDIVKEFAERCNGKYLEMRKKWKLEEVKNNARLFIRDVMELTGHNTSLLFKDLLDFEGWFLVMG